MTYAPQSQVVDPDYIQVRQGVIRRVPIALVTHLSFSDKYVSAHVVGSRPMIVTGSLHLVAAVMGDQIVRIHRSCVVFKRHIIGKRYDCAIGGGWVKISTGEELRVSRSGMKLLD